MGKATIISEVGSGKYYASLIYAGRARVDAKISNLNARISALETEIAAMDPGLKKDIASLRLASLERRLVYFQTKMPADFSKYLFCADLTEGLTGDVATIEIPGERHDGVNIRPGYADGAAFDGATDGQLLPAVATSAQAAYFNRAILPGWQRWKPTHRYGYIVADSINFEMNTCDICLDPAYSSQLNLDINQGQDFSECTADAPSGFDSFCIANPAHPT